MQVVEDTRQNLLPGELHLQTGSCKQLQKPHLLHSVYCTSWRLFKAIRHVLGDIPYTVSPIELRQLTGCTYKIR
jgi:hypothetical protein